MHTQSDHVTLPESCSGLSELQCTLNLTAWQYLSCSVHWPPELQCTLSLIKWLYPNYMHAKPDHGTIPWSYPWSNSITVYTPFYHVTIPGSCPLSSWTPWRCKSCLHWPTIP